ncbi:hypothetical protein BJ165DRAFT_1535661 [Panaeolus papilionaceus]|nr:hypothetical protein BJ165DRAFT_1535661 [Panaeolus papilionaceus]
MLTLQSFNTQNNICVDGAPYIRGFEFNGNIVPDGAHNQRNYVGLSTLLLLPRLEELVFNGLQRFCPLPSILGFEPALSFDLHKLVIHAEKEEEIRLLLELYHDQATLMSVRPFDRLREFRVSADGRVGGDVPVEHIRRVLEMTHLETFGLSWGWTTSMTELWKIYDRLAMYITSRDNMLKNLQIPVLAFPNFDVYDEAMAKLVGFSNSIAVSNTLEDLRISFSTNAPSHPLLNLFQSFPLGPWRDVAELLKSPDNFPSLKSVVIDWTCLRQRNTDEVMINSVDSLAHYHFRMAMKPLAERPAVKSSLNWSTTIF